MDVQGKSVDPNNDALLDACVAAAKPAAEIIRRGTSRLPTIRWEEKGASDFVSDVDRGAEEAIREVLLSHFPSAVILGEELSPGGAAASPDIAFVVDPLDGTTNFLHGYPEYAVSIGALSRGSLAAGVVFNVATGEKFTATANGGAFLDGKRIGVSKIIDHARALIGTGFPFKKLELLQSYLPQLDTIMRATAGIRRAGSAALDLASVACGRFDGFWELDLAPWDVAAGVLLVREAGGMVTDLAGNPAEIIFGPFVAGNPAIHGWLLETLRDAASSRH
jgi:myo-inositol-1(or 4)-monophosphatase